MLRRIGTSLAVVLLTGSFAFAAQGSSTSNPPQQTPSTSSQPADQGTTKAHKKKTKKHRKHPHKAASKGKHQAR
jgi:hypothetical protein